jgi:flagellum-specific peptidoglycan hydrolase FlgJ
LKKCGYATDPHYADRLIDLIERYELNDYDTEDSKKGNRFLPVPNILIRKKG